MSSAMPLGRDFRLFASGQALSWFGDAFQPVALAVAVVAGGGSAGELGLLMAAMMAARIVCTLAGGVWADRLSPRAVMICSDALMAVATAVMGTLFALGRASFLVLLVCTLVSGAASAFFMPAMGALKPTLMPMESRSRGNALLGALQGGARVVGPASAGAVVGLAGAPIGFWVNAASFVASLLAIAGLRVRVERLPAATKFFTDLALGWHSVRERTWLVAGIGSAGVYHVANGVVLVLVQIVAIRELGGAHALGTIAAAEGLGGLLGSVVALRVRPGHPLRSGFLALGLMPFWVAGYVWPGTLPAVVRTGLLGYAGLMYFDAMWQTALQNNVPHGVLARVTSWDTLVSFVGMPLGNALAGVLAEAAGIRTVLLVCAGVILISGLAPLAWRSTRELPLEPNADRPDPAPLTPLPG